MPASDKRNTVTGQRGYAPLLLQVVRPASPVDGFTVRLCRGRKNGRFIKQIQFAHHPACLPGRLSGDAVWHRDERRGYETAEIKANVAIKGFHTVTLTEVNIKATAAILTEIFGYKQVEQEDNLYRYQTDAVENAALVDLLEMPDAQRATPSGF